MSAARDEAVKALAERFTPADKRNPLCKRARDESDETPWMIPAPIEERMNRECMTTFMDQDGQRSIRALTFYEVVDALIDAGVIK